MFGDGESVIGIEQCSSPLPKQEQVLIVGLFRVHGLRHLCYVRFLLDVKAITRNEVGYSCNEKRLFEYLVVIS